LSPYLISPSAEALVRFYRGGVRRGSPAPVWPAGRIADASRVSDRRQRWATSAFGARHIHICVRRPRLERAATTICGAAWRIRPERLGGLPRN